MMKKSLVDDIEDRAKVRSAIMVVAVILAFGIAGGSILYHTQSRLSTLEKVRDTKPDWSGAYAKVLVYRSSDDPKQRFAMVRIIGAPVSLPPVIFAGADEVVLDGNSAAAMKFMHELSNGSVDEETIEFRGD